MAKSFSEIPAILESIPRAKRFGTYFEKNTGRFFDELVLTSDPMRFEAADLIAIEMLSVRLLPEGAATLLLDQDFAAACSHLLRRIPTDAALADATADLVSVGSPADDLWKLLRENVKGLRSGRTVLFKLMAAKRPQLFPVWDTKVDAVVRDARGRVWEPMRRLLADPRARERIEAATSDAPAHVGLLRRIDVALWRNADTLPAES